MNEALILERSPESRTIPARSDIQRRRAKEFGFVQVVLDEVTRGAASLCVLVTCAVGPAQEQVEVHARGGGLVGEFSAQVGTGQGVEGLLAVGDACGNLREVRAGAVFCGESEG